MNIEYVKQYWYCLVGSKIYVELKHVKKEEMELQCSKIQALSGSG